ncbi:MAG: hypothetical protein IKP73_15085 [Bacteroidales bacterium]|nr:hypothetical protein [Bacteroidales bacterium]MBR6265369.1 hypothetical protein [Bacteroidales bacterium]
MASIKAFPEDYGLKVRTHPGVLQITALNKMRTAKVIEVSWGGRLIETYQLSMDNGIRNKNLVTTIDFINSLGGFVQKDSHYIWRNISAERVCDFFQNFELPKSLAKVNLELIVKYVKQLVNKGELNSWSVALLSKSDSQVKFGFTNDINVGCWNRKPSEESNASTFFIRNNHIVGNQKDEFVDLNEQILEKAKERTIIFASEKGKVWDKDYPSPKIVREEFRPTSTPLLMIYPLNPKYVNESDNSGKPFVGFAISFPHTNSGVAVSYAVNQIGDFADTEEYFEENNDNEYDE